MTIYEYDAELCKVTTVQGARAAITSGRVVIVPSEMSRNLGAAIARHRLNEIIRSDRESAPCWRWVKRWGGDPLIALAFAFMATSGEAVANLCRSRYRWSRRQ